MVKADRLSLVGVYVGPNRKRCGSMVLNLANMPSELVYVAVGGRIKGGSIYVTLLPVCCEMAEAMGAKSVRAHASRKGIGRWLQRVGFRETERVYRLNL